MKNLYVHFSIFFLSSSSSFLYFLLVIQFFSPSIVKLNILREMVRAYTRGNFVMKSVHASDMCLNSWISFNNVVSDYDKEGCNVNTSSKQFLNYLGGAFIDFVVEFFTICWSIENWGNWLFFGVTVQIWNHPMVNNATRAFFIFWCIENVHIQWHSRYPFVATRKTFNCCLGLQFTSTALNNYILIMTMMNCHDILYLQSINRIWHYWDVSQFEIKIDLNWI